MRSLYIVENKKRPGLSLDKLPHVMTGWEKVKE
jgi:hypothetical protein